MLDVEIGKGTFLGQKLECIDANDCKEVWVTRGDGPVGLQLTKTTTAADVHLWSADLVVLGELWLRPIRDENLAQCLFEAEAAARHLACEMALLWQELKDEGKP